MALGAAIFDTAVRSRMSGGESQRGVPQILPAPAAQPQIKISRCAALVSYCASPEPSTRTLLAPYQYTPARAAVSERSKPMLGAAMSICVAATVRKDRETIYTLLHPNNRLRERGNASVDLE